MYLGLMFSAITTIQVIIFRKMSRNLGVVILVNCEKGGPLARWLKSYSGLHEQMIYAVFLLSSTIVKTQHTMCVVKEKTCHLQ